MSQNMFLRLVNIETRIQQGKTDAALLELEKARSRQLALRDLRVASVQCVVVLQQLQLAMSDVENGAPSESVVIDSGSGIDRYLEAAQKSVRQIKGD